MRLTARVMDVCVTGAGRRGVAVPVPFGSVVPMGVQEIRDEPPGMMDIVEQCGRPGREHRPEVRGQKDQREGLEDRVSSAHHAVSGV